jgi:phosphoglycolate phosphatase-like HAD superfamily hydrolase
VATNRSTTIGRVLELNHLAHCFDIVVSSLDVQNPKPHPESLFKILDFFDLKPDACLYVGDSQVDFEVCRAGEVPLVACKNTSLEAMLHIESLGELREFLAPQKTLTNAPV